MNRCEREQMSFRSVLMDSPFGSGAEVARREHATSMMSQVDGSLLFGIEREQNINMSMDNNVTVC